MAEVPKNDIEDKKLGEGEQSDSKLHADMEKGGEDVKKGMDSMAKQEVDTIKKGFSADELKNPRYTEQFASEQKKLESETEAILNGPGKPEEKTRDLKIAFEAFKERLAAIKGTKEGMDAERSTRQSKNIQTENERDEKGSQEFKTSLLRNMQNAREIEMQKEIKAARFLKESESEKSKVAANETL